MSKTKSYEQSFSEVAQNLVNKGGIAFMAVAAMLGTVEMTHNREKALVPVVSNASFANINDLVPASTDNTLRREKESEVGAHGTIYTIAMRTPSRAGKQ